MKEASIKMLLLVEDNEGDARLLREMLNDEGWQNTEMTTVASMRDAELHLSEHQVDFILLDLGLPDSQGMAAVRRAHAAAPRIPLVVLTGSDDETLALQALQEGAQDYLIKGQTISSAGQIEARGLLRALRYAVERKAMEEALFDEKERALVTLNSIGDAVACTDTEGNLTFFNVVAERLSGWSWQEAAGRPASEILRIIDAVSRKPVSASLKKAVSDDRIILLPANSLLLRRDGSEVAVEDSVAPIHDRLGKAIGAVMVLRDVSATRSMALQIIHAAEHDVLTNLPNRLFLNDRINQAIASAPRHRQLVAVLFLDLDGFKHINDSLGHSIGDKLLQSIAASLVNCVRGSDTVSRQGGDEFVVLLSEVERPEDAAITARRILKAVSEPRIIDQHDLHITASIGVSVFPDDGMDSESLIQNADTAMYQAKENGRQSFQFFKPSMNLRAVERQSIEESLRRAIEREEFELYYQPKIDLQTGNITGAEALLRWTHPTRGSISPAQFIPVAEACGLILPISAWVLREACRQSRAWVGAGLPMISIAVNVSGMDFREEDFLENLSEILAETGMDPCFLQLELTESILMHRAETTASTLQALREKGVTVAIDDFGTGYSSLSYLRKFPVDVLKIDQSFVRQISSGSKDKVLVATVINMARSLRLRVVAEGVETLDELRFLQGRQCDEAQGYYFSRPLPAAKFAELLATGLEDKTWLVREHVPALEEARSVPPILWRSRANGGACTD